MTTIAPPTAEPRLVPAPAPSARLARLLAGTRAGEAAWVLPATAGVLALAAVLYIVNLTVSGYANVYYSGAAWAASQSWSAWFMGAIDPASFITVDKPPLATMVMGLSVRLFGLSSASILLPQALMGVGTVALLMATVRRTFGGPGVDHRRPRHGAHARRRPDLPLQQPRRPAHAAPRRVGVRAHPGARAQRPPLDRARRRPRRPGLRDQAPPGLPRAARVRHRLCGRRPGLDPPPPGRPRRGRGLGDRRLRMVGGGHGAHPRRVARLHRRQHQQLRAGSRPRLRRPRPHLRPGRGRRDARWWQGGGGFSGTPGFLRLFNSQLGGQIAWFLPLAVVGLVAGLASRFRAPRTDLARAAFLMWGGWLAVHAIVFSLMSGVIHSYYVVAMAPAVGALVGGGVVAMWRARERHPWVGLVLGLALLGSAGVALMLLERTPDFVPGLGLVVLAVTAVTLPILALPASVSRGRVQVAAAVLGIAMLLAAPAAYAVDTMQTAYSGGDPSAGPASTSTDGGPGNGIAGGRGAMGQPPSGGTDGGPGNGGFGGGQGGSLDTATLDYLVANQGAAKWIVAVSDATSASQIELSTGRSVMSMGGFTGSDNALTLERLQAADRLRRPPVRLDRRRGGAAARPAPRRGHVLGDLVVHRRQRRGRHHVGLRLRGCRRVAAAPIRAATRNQPRRRATRLVMGTRRTAATARSRDA